MIFDTHSHLNDRIFEKDIEEVIERAVEKGIGKILVVGYDLESSEKALELSHKYAGMIFASCAIHPHDAKEIDSDFRYIEELSKEKNIIAIGETGLDYKKMYSPIEKQKEAFYLHIELALKTKKPLILHIRNAFEDIFKVLSNYKDIRGISHCFSGGIKEAEKLVNMGFKISFAGSLTYGSKKLENSLKVIPEDFLLFETDAPYLPPRPIKGRNEPSYIIYTIRYASKILGKEVEKLAKITYRNALEIFKL